MTLNIITSLLEQKEIMELFRMGVVYLHLLACCVAIGLVLTSDIAMVGKLVKGQSLDKHDNAHMHSLQKTVVLALVLLWVSGAVIIGVDYLEKGAGYFANPKLQAKLMIVLLLSYNGLVLHRFVLPALEKAGSLLDLPFSARMLALFSGSLSAVSWLYAAMLGVGRPLAWKYSLVELLAAYPVLIVAGFAMMVLLTQWAKNRNSSEKPGHKSTFRPMNPALASW